MGVVLQNKKALTMIPEESGALRRTGSAWLHIIRSFFDGDFIPRLLSGLLLLNLLVVALATWSLYQSRLKYEESAQVETRNLASLLDHDISATIRSIDLTLQVTVLEAERQLAAGWRGEQDFNRFIQRQLFQEPDLDSLRILDAQGAITHGAGVAGDTRQSMADRDYFMRLRSQPGAGLIISKPVLGRIQQRWIIILARAIRRPDGGFAGVAMGSIPLERFTRVFAELAVGKNGTFILFDDERRIVTRHPALQVPGNGVGTKFGSEALQALLKTGNATGSYQAVSSLDGVKRTFSYRRIKEVPLHISVGLAADEYLAEWRYSVVKTIALVLIFALVTQVLSRLTSRAWKKQEAAVAALVEANRTLDAEKQLNQTIIQSSPFAIYTRNRDGLVTLWNRAAEKLFGWKTDEIVGKSLLSVPPGKEKESEELRQKVLAGEDVIQREVLRQKRDGTVFDLSTTLAPLRNANGDIDGYLAIATDITERKAAEQKIEFLAYRDVLTGLPNRLLLHDRFEQAVAYADRAGTQVGLLFLDLDNFKTINDSLGHAVGDALLQEIARRLGECVRDTDTISRQGGDEFLVVLPDLNGSDAITPVLIKIWDRLQAPFEFDGHELSTSGSMGIAIYPNDGKDFDTLLKKADTAMYRAKDGGRNSYRFFDEQMNVEAVEHLSLKTGLRRALAREEFVLHYQPRINLGTGAVVGAEALIRWNHPERGLMPPAQFIPVAEDSGLIVPMGEWVIREACRQAMAWRKDGLPGFVLAVNLSAVQFKRDDVEKTVKQALHETGFDPRDLELELTESILIHDTEKILATVKQLKRQGVRLSIDDFGTGYSSLSYLKRFDVDKLKIDRSFVRDLATDPDDAAIVRAIIQMARSLGLGVVAEGVEDAATLAQLRHFQCDEAQGYYFARPLPAQAFADFLANQKAQQFEGEWVI